MGSKELLYNREAREKLLAGVNKIADAVKVTLGAKGRNVMFTNGSVFLAPTVTNDGVTIAKQIELKDPFENMGAQLIREVAQKTNDTSGDGTTTATILAQAIINEGLKNVAAGANPMELKKGIEKAVNNVVDKLKSMAQPIVDKSDIEKIATISSGDPEIGKAIAEVFDKIGKDGIISVEESNTVGISKEIVEGMNFPKGLLSPYMITDQERMKCVIEKPAILLTDKKITTTNEIVPILTAIVNSGKKDLVIIADDISADGLTALIVNKMKGIINVCAVQAPGFGDNRKELLGDIAVLTGATLITSDIGIEFGDFTMDMLGRADRVISDKDSTTIVNGGGTDIKDREAQIKELIKNNKDSNQALLLTDRLAKLTGGVGVIRVGAVSELEMKEKKFRVEDAVEATKAAIEEGIVAGGGVALLNCDMATQIVDEKPFSDEERIGMDIVRRAIKYPIKQIAENAGTNGDVIIKEIDSELQMNARARSIAVSPQQRVSYGWDCRNDKYGDMFEMGIIDPVKVTRCALENAASIAAMILTTEVIIADEVKNV